jgi:peptide/nickel transport system permease protein
MAAFLIRRVVLGALVVAALSCVCFCAFTYEAGGGDLHSVLAAYGTWAKGLWGGPSLHVLSQATFERNFTQAPVTMLGALGHTAVLLGLTLLLVVGLSVGLALVAASRRGSALDLFLRGLSYAAWAVPAFLLALLVQLLVNTVGGSRGIGPFPLAGWPGTCPAGIGINAGHLTPCPAAGSGVRYVLNVLRYTTLPAITLALGFVGLHARYLRSALLETLDAPFVTTARAKGLPERTVLIRHALRTSLATFVGALLSDFGTILGTAIAVDFVFQLNGLGTVFISEFPTGQGTVDPFSMTPLLTLTALLVVVCSIVADVVVFHLDPRRRTTR